jgi:hypothetical protein
MRARVGGCGWGGLPPRDARAAREEASSLALGQDKASLLVVSSSDAYDLEVLIRTIGERSGGAPLIGCSTACGLLRSLGLRTLAGLLFLAAAAGDSLQSTLAAWRRLETGRLDRCLNPPR